MFLRRIAACLRRERIEPGPGPSIIADGEGRLGDSGRIVIRKSGTEPVIRVMAEGDDEALVTSVVDSICTSIEAAAS